MAATLPLDQIAKRIAQQEAALKALRQDYEARTKQLATLNRRKQELQKQLQEVEGQIHALTAKGAVPVAPPTRTAAKTPLVARSRNKSAAPSAANQPLSLPQLLPVLLRGAGRPLTNKELTEAVQRKFPYRTGDLLKQVSTRVSELVKKGILRRTEDETAVTLSGNANGQPKKPTPKAAPAAKPAPAAAPKPAATPSTPAKARQTRPSLASVLTGILEKSDKPLSGPELARRAQAAGYQSKSQDFPNVVWVMLGKMDNVENVKGQGYRLKKTS